MSGIENVLADKRHCIRQKLLLHIHTQRIKDAALTENYSSTSTPKG